MPQCRTRRCNVACAFSLVLLCGVWNFPTNLMSETKPGSSISQLESMTHYSEISVEIRRQRIRKPGVDFRRLLTCRNDTVMSVFRRKYLVNCCWLCSGEWPSSTLNPSATCSNVFPCRCSLRYVDNNNYKKFTSNIKVYRAGASVLEGGGMMHVESLEFQGGRNNRLKFWIM